MAGPPNAGIRSPIKIPPKFKKVVVVHNKCDTCKRILNKCGCGEPAMFCEYCDKNADQYETSYCNMCI